MLTVSHTAARPVPVRVTMTSQPGIDCGCCRCCVCLHLSVLKTTPGLFKLGELVLGAICLSLVLNYGLQYVGDMARSYGLFLVAASSCLVTTALLLFCYLVSENTARLIRSSIFEAVFNLAACVLYLVGSAYLSFMVNTYLWSLYVLVPFFQVYPAMTATYVLGFVAAAVHGTDSYLAFRFLRRGA